MGFTLNQQTLYSPAFQSEIYAMRTLACVFMVLFLSACGQKGPLFLPDSENTDSTATEQSTETSPEKSDNSTGDP